MITIDNRRDYKWILRFYLTFVDKEIPIFNKYPYPSCNLRSDEGYVSFLNAFLINIDSKEFAKLSFHNWLIVNFYINFGESNFPLRKHHILCGADLRLLTHLGRSGGPYHVTTQFYYFIDIYR